MLDIERIQKLVDMMIAHDLVELSLRDGDLEVNLRRPQGGVIHGVPEPTNTTPSHPTGAMNAQPEDAEESNLVEITSPMVGTYYAAPDPDSPPFVQTGSRVQSDSVVCIVEAMKVFNEIKAEINGTIDRILIKNEQPIEYGQALFVVRAE